MKGGSKKMNEFAAREGGPMLPPSVHGVSQVSVSIGSNFFFGGSPFPFCGPYRAARYPVVHLSGHVLLLSS
jgi:hypothetical protein